MIRVNGACISFGDIQVLKDVGFTAAPGEVLGIIGPNGSGKSTLMRMVAGVQKPDSGEVLVDGVKVGSYSRRSLARFMAVLEQDALPSIGFTVREVIEMGRYPHQNWLGRDSKDTAALVDGILEKLVLADLAERTVDHLSGGERQRVALGKAMAQEPRLLLLDEPTTFLDIGYQLQMMDHVREWREASGLTVVAVLHDLNLAAQYCDRILVLKDGRMAAEGEPCEILLPDLIERVYGTRPIVVEHPGTGAPQILLQPGGGRKPVGKSSDHSESAAVGLDADAVHA